MGPLASHTILKAYLERRNSKQRKERGIGRIAKQRKERKHMNRKLSVGRKQRTVKHKNFIGTSV